ncbi:MAG: AIR synthase-related protein [Lachnospiraceae bacterium]|jgi:hydrogenase maturation factor|nr:AIR synthase-related protein [Lachnospiraceae bacterium]MCH4028755.1 AIR synthase-related protein [Lachnospiraceae bacterium]MCH4066604.1 AIR synthase-related protein [Lachnospiraceae bacterium]MCH4112635.1 AIR synthase-related protein [Lachnospiraceae bacterium]MCI1353761.1 AIR synthase-related protein [Lachnospiraceae bacterium]
MNRDSDKTLSAGKADVNALDRSVFKRLGKAGAKSAEPNWMGDSGKGGQFVRLSIDPITVGTFLSGKLSVIEAVNGLWAQGAVPCGIETVILLPEGTMESELRRMEDQIAEAARQESVSVLGGHTEVTSAVSRPVIIGSGIGTKEYCLPTALAGFDGQVILMTSFAGLEGSAILGFEKEKELSRQFSASLVQTAKEAADHLSVRSAAEILWRLSGESGFCKNGIRMVNLSEGGFYAGLWKLAEKTHCGVDVDLKKVPILQETIEIANFFDIDPYWMESAGSLLAAIPAGKAEEVLTGLAESSIPAAVIGTLNDSNQKIIRNGDEMRFLDRPQADSLRKILI